MKLFLSCRVVLLLLLLLNVCGVLRAAAADGPVRDVRYFLHRLRTVDHLPELEEAKTAMASTWDRSGGNADGTDYKRIEGATNVLFDMDGPGCVHRLFTGGSEPFRDGLAGYLWVDNTRLQVFIDLDSTPVFDYPVIDFFNPDKGPIPAPLSGDRGHGWTYPGCLFPMPYARHCRVQLVNPGGTNWGSYWQITYTRYGREPRVESLTWPLGSSARAELDAVRKVWLEAQSTPPKPPGSWTLSKSVALDPGESLELSQSGAGVIRQLRVAAQPATSETLRGLRLILSWDGESRPSVDVPVGHFFGHAFSGHSESARYNSLLLGVTADAAYARFPMPFGKGAQFVLRNDSSIAITQAQAFVEVESLEAVPADWGRFRATYHEARAARLDGLHLGPKDVPGHLVLDERGGGKFVGVLMREDWPHEGWWGEGDWMIWSDETGWPPAYHGTGSEEYFNSGWCLFDRKAVSGYIAVRPGHPSQYTFHLNDAFQFRHHIRVAVETMGWDKADVLIREEHPVWGSTAFWYRTP